MTDRDQVARETLASASYKARIEKAVSSLGKAWPVLADHAIHIDGEFSNALDDVKRLVELVNEAHPAPAAPVTVTVEGYSGSPVVREDGLWREADGCIWLDDDSTGLAPLFARIAFDARRIEELEAANASLKAETDRIGAMRQDALGELVRVGHERDEARRALDDLKSRAALGDRDARAALAAQVQAATSQGAGLGKDEPAPTRQEPQGSAPIPIGAVVEVSGITYQRTEVGDWSSAHRWISRNSHEANTLDALYRALHPVADAATVKRVALRVKQYNGPTAVSAEGFARIILEELGYTIQEDGRWARRPTTATWRLGSS